MAPKTLQFELRIPLEYIETTIPPGMAIAEYRRLRPRHRSRWSRLRRGHG